MKFIGWVLLAALIVVVAVGDMIQAGRNEPNVIQVPVLHLVPFAGSTTNELPRATEE